MPLKGRAHESMKKPKKEKRKKKGNRKKGVVWIWVWRRDDVAMYLVIMYHVAY